MQCSVESSDISLWDFQSHIKLNEYRECSIFKVLMLLVSTVVLGQRTVTSFIGLYRVKMYTKLYFVRVPRS